ncbi:unnamed protein product [Gongylonema pulchrum]|uniref:Cadherin domain-containing protein n=1 Tax=Gongylonema pulchrum TaxID=637853 RepID=A0A3P6QLA7_9BILA|nr:unnamed protein product [Gongylonema pulchrum]
MVNVHVEDVNDNAPIFYPEEYNVSVRQNAVIGSPLVRYRFATEDNGNFRLDPNSGRLYLQKRLTKKSYKLTVEAVDGGGLVSDKQATVHIIVIGASTPTPQFTSTLYKFTISEETLPGIEIGQVKATGPYPVRYNLYSGDPEHLFAINERNGQLSVARYLDADRWDELLLNVQVSIN